MTWCNTHTNINIDTNINTNINSSDNINIPTTTEKLSSNQILISPTPSTSSTSKNQPIRTVACYCPSCGNLVHVPLQDQQTGGINALPGLPAGVKFVPTDMEIMTHLEAKVKDDLSNLHPLVDEFIPTIEGENGICYTHPEKLPGVSKDGIMRHFFHCPSKAYTTGTRKRRKVHTDIEGGETRWHKTGKTRPIIVNGAVKGHKKILVLYTNYGRQKKPEKTNWVMHQYHLGENEEENDGEFVLSKVFYQTQPRQCGTSTTTTTTTTSTELALDQHQNVIRNPFTQAPINFHQHQNHQPSLIVPYDHHVGVQKNRESPPQLIPNLVLQGDGSSIVSLSGARNS